MWGRVEQSGTACNEVERSADLSSRCLHWGRVMDDSCSELCKSVCQALQKRIDDPWLTPQNAANMGEKADGMTHCRPETPENERRFPSKPCSRAAQCTWQPGSLATWQLTDDQETKRETLLAHLRVERSFYVLSIILCIINFSTKIRR